MKKTAQTEFQFSLGEETVPSSDILCALEKLMLLWKSGSLGGETMPEDVHPKLDMSSEEIACYFTLGMSLNFQRNSYTLWNSCTKTYDDLETNWVFSPRAVCAAEKSELRAALTKYKVALQPNKHVEIWAKVSSGILEYGGGSIKEIFSQNNFDISDIRQFLRDRKTSFPYLNGPKLCNYWLFVMLQYMNWPITNRKALSVAPDTHVIQSTRKLGLISEVEFNKSDVAELVGRRWEDLLEGSTLCPIDVHTPLWLWSRSGFPSLR
jgi:hypothetical protein